jgi:hypothetical protein
MSDRHAQIQNPWVLPNPDCFFSQPSHHLSVWHYSVALTKNLRFSPINLSPSLPQTQPIQHLCLHTCPHLCYNHQALMGPARLPISPCPPQVIHTFRESCPWKIQIRSPHSPVLNCPVLPHSICLLIPALSLPPLPSPIPARMPTHLRQFLSPYSNFSHNSYC